MAVERALDACPSVEVWSAGLREQWGGDPLAEDPGKLDSLRRFCEFTGQDPDALVAFCFLRKRDSGVRFASVARRAELAAKLRAWVEKLPASERRRASASVLSFLIHNGVMMNPGVARTTPDGAGPGDPPDQPA